jgi:hypothetical protein
MDWVCYALLLSPYALVMKEAVIMGGKCMNCIVDLIPPIDPLYYEKFEQLF